MKKWVHKTFSKQIKVTPPSEKVESEAPVLIAQAPWCLESGRTVVFYNGHPKFVIIAGAKGRLVATRRVFRSSYVDLFIGMYYPKKEEPPQCNLLVQIGGNLLAINRTLVRIVEAPKPKRKRRS